jgi:uncharacterized small protein (DUF1192 family)
MSEPWTTDTEPGITRADRDALDTIALLQEEVARLEGELRARDEAAFATETEPEPRRDDPAPAEEARRQIEALNAELAGREEAIALLLEQTRLLEEAEASSRAEWDQLRQWVEEVERRVEQRDGAGPDLKAELEAERRQAASQRHTAEGDRRLWDAQRGALEQEIEQLRATLAQVVGRTDSAAAALVALERENQRLRDACRQRTSDSAAAAEVEALRQQVQAAWKERDDLKGELRRVQDDRRRESNEHEAALGDLRSQIALESLKRQQEQVAAAPLASSAPNALLEADERIRAFRQHLQEIHQLEAEQRMKRSLAARLSRLWRHTGPNP